jgi:esterase/lipase
MMLVAGGVKVKPAPPVERDKTDHVLTQLKNQERELNVTQKLETHNRETGEVKKTITEFGVKLEKLSAAIRGVISNFKQMEQAVTILVQKQQAMLGKPDRGKEERQKNNTVILYLEERSNE